jgi:hypothetical protein
MGATAPLPDPPFFPFRRACQSGCLFGGILFWGSRKASIRVSSTVNVGPVDISAGNPGVLPIRLESGDGMMTIFRGVGMLRIGWLALGIFQSLAMGLSSEENAGNPAIFMRDPGRVFVRRNERLLRNSLAINRPSC